MNDKYRIFFKNLELGIVVYLLLVAESLNIKSNLTTTFINLSSYALVALLVMGRWKKVASAFTKSKTLLLLIGFAFASIFWSAAIPETLDQLRGLTRASIFGAYLATRYSLRDQMRLLTWMIVLSMILSTAVCILLPGVGIVNVNGVNSWFGIYGHKQYLGRNMAVGASIFLVTALDKKSRSWSTLAGFITAVILIVLSTSKTSLVLLCLALFLLPIYKMAKQQYIFRVVLIFTALVIVASIGGVIIVNLETIVIDILGKDLEFNGRTPLWTAIIEKVSAEQPWTGYGLGAFWTTEAGREVVLSTWFAGTDAQDGYHAHNGYIDLYAQLGLLGSFLFYFDVLFLIKRIIYLLVSTKTIESFWMLEFIAIMLVVNTSELITFLTTNMFWIIYVSITISSVIECNRIKKTQYLSTSPIKLKIAG